MLQNRKVGILAHQASVDSNLRYSFQLLKEAGCDLIVIFAPEHGLYAVQQDQIPISNGLDPLTKTKIISVYPPKEWDRGIVDEIDLLVIDIFDIGTRYYTYLWSATNLLESVTNQGVIVCDRPNPIGREIEGPIVDEELLSFVGAYPIPIRHGMTPGELLTMINDKYLRKNLEVIRVDGWNCSYYDAPWVPPSPNMPYLTTAIVYPGGCLIEGTNLSEGRGTTRPFEQIGAPWLDSHQIIKSIGTINGGQLRPVYFQPQFSKYNGKICNGIFIHVIDPSEFDPLRVYLELIQEIIKLHPDEFSWLKPPYEGEWKQMPFDLLIGKKGIRKRIVDREPIIDILNSYRDELSSFAEERRGYLIY